MVRQLTTGACLSLSKVVSWFVFRAGFWGDVRHGCVHHYTTTGLGAEGRSAFDRHDLPRRLPGFMDAMVMPFDVKGDARAGEAHVAGDRVKFRLAVKGARSWVDQVDVISAAPVDAGLQQTPAVPVLVPVGSPLPNFELTDQDNRRVALSSLRGKVVAVTFIYTRCPLPDYCPRMVHNFRDVRRPFRRADGPRPRPPHDQLRSEVRYARDAGALRRVKRAGGPGWHFLTGDPADVERVCNAFGIQYWPEEGMITHSLQTAVIDRDGRLAGRSKERNSRRKQLGDLVEAVLDKYAIRHEGHRTRKTFGLDLLSSVPSCVERFLRRACCYCAGRASFCSFCTCGRSASRIRPGLRGATARLARVGGLAQAVERRGQAEDARGRCPARVPALSRYRFLRASRSRRAPARRSPSPPTTGRGYDGGSV